jgi:sulfide:quinone oxidoreductase
MRMPPSSAITAPEESPRRVLIAGGGVAGLETMLALRALAGSSLQIDVLAPKSTFHYRPLSVAQPFGLGGVRHLSLTELIESGGGRHLMQALVSVDAERKVVQTTSGVEIPYDALVVAVGARTKPAIEGALTFRGERDLASLRQLMSELGREPSTLAFVLPRGTSRTLPLYELALMTAGELAARPGSRRTKLVLVTPETAPLVGFGPEISGAITTLLEREGIVVRSKTEVLVYREGRLELLPRGEQKADHVVAMPLLYGPEIPGLPHDEEGFMLTDEFGRVRGLCDVYAAGDITSHPIKQGGLASQQADVVATAIAAWAGVPIQPRPYRPVFRAQLYTAGAPRFIEIALGEHEQAPPSLSFHPPSWPAGKITAAYLTPFLAERGVGDPIGWPQPEAET